MHVEFTERIDEDAARLSRVRAAYLTAFAHAGYSVACSPAYTLVRDAIRHLDVALLPPTSITSLDAPRDRRALWYLTRPDLGPAIVVQFGRTSVFLPGDGADREFFTRALDVVARLAGGEPVAGSMTRVEWPLRAEYRYDLGLRAT
jgi:hypothetical protein